MFRELPPLLGCHRQKPVYVSEILFSKLPFYFYPSVQLNTSAWMAISGVSRTQFSFKTYASSVALQLLGNTATLSRFLVHFLCQHQLQKI